MLTNCIDLKLKEEIKDGSKEIKSKQSEGSIKDIEVNELTITKIRKIILN